MLDGRYGKWISTGMMTMALGAFGCSGTTGDVGAQQSTPDEAGATQTTSSSDEGNPSTDTPAQDDEVPSTPASPAGGALDPCAGPQPSARCSADPQTFDAYGAASLVSSFRVLSDGSCCVDFDDDGKPDNALGQGLADIGKLDGVNEEFRTSILDGSQTIVLEMPGLDDLQNDSSMSLLVWKGVREDDSDLTAGGRYGVKLDRSSIDQGVAPLFAFDQAQVSAGMLHAAKGVLELQATFDGVPMLTRVYDATIDARLEAETSAGGVALRDGSFAGVVKVADIDAEMNEVATGCDCLGLDGPLLQAGNPGQPGVCSKPDTSACKAAGRTECTGLVALCPVMDLIASNLADQDTDGDGVADAISVGATFGAERASIDGVAN